MLLRNGLGIVQCVVSKYIEHHLFLLGFRPLSFISIAVIISVVIIAAFYFLLVIKWFFSQAVMVGF